jgi:hypothetical protein
MYSTNGLWSPDVVPDEIALANERELTANENALAQCFPPPPVLSEAAKMAVVPFLQWAEVQRVRALPARPASVAAFICLLKDQNVSRQIVVETLSAIEALHIAAAVANPVATPIVSATLGTTVEPPRSWKKEDKAFFTTLPLHAQEIIASREQDREVHLRRSQNELAKMRKRLPDGAAKPVDNTTTEKGIDNMAKNGDWNGPQGSEDMGKDPLKSSQPDPGANKSKDIFKVVTENAERTDGFSAKITPKE